MGLYDGVGDGHGVGVYIKNSGKVWRKIHPRRPEHHTPSLHEQTGGKLWTARAAADPGTREGQWAGAWIPGF